MNVIIIPQVAIRQATIADRNLICTGFLQMLRELQPLGHDAAPTWHNVFAYWNTVFAPSLESGFGCIFLAEASRMVVGVLLWAMNSNALDWNEAYATDHGCWVHPEWRRQQVATRLREAGMARLAEIGVTALTTTILHNNEAGLASYNKLSPQVIGVLTKVKV